MTFLTRATSKEEYEHWLKSVKQSPKILDWDEYSKLAAPSMNNPVEIYQLKTENLFDRILMKFMHPQKI